MLPDQFNCTIAVIGLGYVGLPLALQFIYKNEKSKFKRKVIGFDINQERIIKLKKGIDSTNEINKNDLYLINKIDLTSKNYDLIKADIFIITVPTPINDRNEPDLEPLKEATKTVGKIIKLRANERSSTFDKFSTPIVIYESTVFPGATEEICIPIIEKCSGFKLNNLENYQGFVCGYSPERINPGDKNRKISDIIKVTSGSNKVTSEWIDCLYKSIIDAGTYRSENIKTAEAAKIIENTQRDLNIALINEFSIIFKKLGLNTNEVLKAASTKWNFLNFTPGLVGGHCIGVDPYYLTFKAKKLGYNPEIILAGRKINNNMPNWIFEELSREIIKRGKEINGSKILILGLTFKENVPDLRNTKVIDIINLLYKNKMIVKVVDPLACAEEAKKLYRIDLLNKIPPLNEFDVILGAVPHDKFFEMISYRIKNDNIQNKLFFDIKGLFDKWDLNQVRI